MQKIYVSGCGGMLGEAFYYTFKNNYQLKCTDIILKNEWLSFLDIRDLDNYRQDVLRFKPDYLFHLGAHTDLEYCELNPDDAYLTNTISVENACYIAEELGIPLLYIGTAGIFDGKKYSYDDWDTPNPLGIYAKTKYLGEVIVKERLKRYFICRAGWMMGGGENKDKKYVNKIMMQIKHKKNQLFIVNDKYGTPTYTYDFANNVNKLLNTGYWGVYNMVCEGETSRLDIAREMLSIMKLDKTIEIVEVDSKYFNKDYFADRPASERLINKKLQYRGLNNMRSWKLALREYLEKEYLK